MSLDAMLWALHDSPAADTTERLILEALGDKADSDGCNAFPSRRTMARVALCDIKTVQRKLAELQERGVIRLGDQSAARYIPEHVRPKVYDLMIPASWYGDRLVRVNTDRAAKGLPPLTEETRPPLAPAPTRTVRSDKGRKRPKQNKPRGGTLSPPPSNPGESDQGGDSQSRGGGDSQSPGGGLSVPQSCPVTQSTTETLSSRPSVLEAEVVRASGSDPEGRTDSGSGVVEDQGQPAAAEVSPGEVFLRRVGRHHPEIGAGLAQGTTLADQARVVNGLLLAGVSREEIRAVLVDRPYPAPAERKRSMAALIAARLGQIVPPLGLDAVPQVPAQAPAPENAAGPMPTLTLHRTNRPECPECGLDSPDGALCGACQGWPLCEGGCKRRVREGGLCASCAAARRDDGANNHVGVCPGFGGQRCGRPVAAAGLCPRCQVRAAAAKEARDADWAAKVAAATAAVEEEQAAVDGPTSFLLAPQAP